MVCKIKIVVICFLSMFCCVLSYSANSSAEQKVAQTLAESAKILYFRGEKDKAFAKAQESYRMSDEIGLAYELLSDIYIERNMLTEAEQLIKKAEIKKLISKAMYYKLAVIYSQKGEADASQIYVDKLLAINPSDKNALALKSDYFIKTNQNTKALEILRLRLISESENPNIHYQIAYIYLDRFDLVGAYRSFINAEKYNYSDKYWLYYFLSLVCHGLDKKVEENNYSEKYKEEFLKIYTEEEWNKTKEKFEANKSKTKEIDFIKS